MNALLLVLALSASDVSFSVEHHPYDATLEKPNRTAAASVVPGYVWIDAEDFTSYGGWKADTQFVYLMGSAYLIAPGVGTPVSDATTELTIAQAGRYRVWVRHRDWFPEHHPGRFSLVVDEAPLPTILGEAERDDWHWTPAGDVELAEGSHALALHDLSGAFARCDALVLTTDMEYVPPHEVRAIEMERARLTNLDLTTAYMGDFDVVVVGGGTGGCPAAIAAARLGVKTALIQDRPVLGGNASIELGVGARGGGGFKPNANEGGIMEELARIRTENNFPRLSRALEILTKAEPHLTVFYNTRVIDAGTVEGRRIASLKAVDTLTGARKLLDAKYVIDATGDGWVGYYAGAKYRLGREARWQHDEEDAPPTPDRITMSGCIMGRCGISYWAENAGEPVTYTPPPWAAPIPNLAKIRRSPRNIVTGEWWMEHPGHWDDLFDAERARDELIRISFGYWDYVKNVWEKREKAANLRMVYVPYINAKRESRRLIGDYILTTNDVLDMRLFPDRISYTGWPVDIHNPKGIYGGEEGPYHIDHHFPEVASVPFRCIYSTNIDNLLMAGRCVSVTHLALGTVRVERTLATLGQAAGTAAALCVKHDLTPRELHDTRIKELQQVLLKYDQFIPEMSNEDPDDLARKAKVTASSVSSGLAYTPDMITFSNEIHAMDHRRAQMLPVAKTPHVGTAYLRLRSTASKPVTVRLHLRDAKGLRDYSSTKDVAVVEAAVPPGKESWVAFPLNADVTTPLIWCWAEPAPGVEWRLMASGGLKTNRAYASKNADGVDAWKLSGGTYAIYLDPPATEDADYRAKNIIDGFARTVGDDSHMWSSEPGQKLPQWIELRYDSPVTFNTVHLTFDTDMDSRFASDRRPLRGVRAYALLAEVDGTWKTIAEETDNFQRWRRHRFEEVTATALRLEVREISAYNTARVFEIRVYEEDQPK